MPASVEPYQDIAMPDTPTVGTNYTYTVPGDTRVVIVSAMCELAAAAGGSARNVSLQLYTWTGRRFLVAGTAAPQSPATTSAYSWQSAAAAGVWTVDDAALAGMPRVTLLPMCTAVITVTGLQAGDQLSEIALVLEHYPPRDVDAGPAAFPILDAVADLKIPELASDVRDLRDVVVALTDGLGAHRAELQRDRRQRVLTAVT